MKKFIIRLILTFSVLSTSCFAAPVKVIYYAPTNHVVMNQITTNVWTKVAALAGMPFVLIPTQDKQQALAWLASGKGDIIVGPLKPDINSQKIDYLNTYISAQTGVIVNSQVKLSLEAKMISLLHSFLGKGIMAMFGIMIFFGIILWLAERRHPMSAFPKHPIKGLGATLWFQLETISTIGYGDYIPKSVLGRIATSVMILSCMFFLSAFLASITAEASLLEARATQITTLPELQGKTVAYIKGDNIVLGNINKYYALPLACDNINAVVAAVASQQATAGFSNRLALREYINAHPGQKIRLTPFQIDNGEYTFAMRRNDPLENKVNRALYALHALGTINAIIDRQVGTDNVDLTISNSDA